MSNIRLQADRHWIQIDMEPFEGKRRLVHIDLNMVDEVVAVLDDDRIPTHVRITYAGVLKPIDLVNWTHSECWAARDFYKLWCEFIELRAETPAAKPGILHIAGSSQLKI